MLLLIFRLQTRHEVEIVCGMENSPSLEKKASLYAGSKIKELRGKQSRVAFGERIGVTEASLYKYERGMTNIGVGTLARFANCLSVPLSTFILPDDLAACSNAEGESDDSDERKYVA